MNCHKRNCNNQALPNKYLCEEHYKEALIFIVNRHNDTGPDDDYFDEWWTAENIEVHFRCDTKENAEKLAEILNKHWYDN